MKGNVALMCEQGVRFAVVVVSPSLMSGLRSERDGAVQAFSTQFGAPAVLMVQDSRGIPIYYGRPDLVGLLEERCPEQLPWREFATQAA